MFYKHLSINTDVKRRTSFSWLDQELHQSRVYNLPVPWRVTFLDSLLLSVCFSHSPRLPFSSYSFPSLFLYVFLSPAFSLPLPFLPMCLSSSNRFVNHQVGCLILHFTFLLVYFTKYECLFIHMTNHIHAHNKSIIIVEYLFSTRLY